MLYSVTEHAFEFKSHLILHTVTSETHEERNIRSEKSSASKCETKSGINQEKQEKQVIPGLGAYSDSSDSDSSSDES